jgi:hypothetical protein
MKSFGKKTGISGLAAQRRCLAQIFAAKFGSHIHQSFIGIDYKKHLTHDLIALIQPETI